MVRLVRFQLRVVARSSSFAYKESAGDVRRIGWELGADSVLECVGYQESMVTSLNIARPGGAVGRVGVPQDDTIPASELTFYNNVTIAGGPAPVRAYIEELLPDVLEGRINPGKVFGRFVHRPREAADLPRRPHVTRRGALPD